MRLSRLLTMVAWRFDTLADTASETIHNMTGHILVQHGGCQVIPLHIDKQARSDGGMHGFNSDPGGQWNMSLFLPVARTKP